MDGWTDRLTRPKAIVAIYPLQAERLIIGGVGNHEFCVESLGITVVSYTVSPLSKHNV